MEKQILIIVFDGKIKFEGARFRSRVNFHESKFNYASFDDAEFERTDFYKAEFNGKTSFQAVPFHDEVDFIKAIFGSETDFNYTLFEASEKTFFDIEDLSNVSFRNCDISRVKFGEWVFWGGLDGFTVIDEKEA